MKSRISRLALAIACSSLLFTAVLVPATPAQAIPVFDVTNYSQNLLQAARALQQINQQIQSLQNEATMITRLDKNLLKTAFPELAALKDRLQKIDDLMQRASAIDFRIDGFEDRMKAMFPDAVDTALKSDVRLAGAKARLDAAMAGFKKAMTVQAQIVENVRGDASTLGDLVKRSQDAEGGLQATQTTNQILALATKQQFQLQTMMAAEFRSNALEAARRTQAEAEAREMTKRFLGDGRAYTPR